MSQSTSKIAQFIRKVPGMAQVEGEFKGAIAEEGDLPIAGYDKATAAEITEKLSGFSQIELAKIDAYERRHENRTTVLAKLTTLRGSEPWPGYDELTAEEIIKATAAIDAADGLKAVVKYERAHKDRSTVIAAAERRAA
ncbi:MAG TPA: hypothetical protein VFR49_14685 [Solirubrobacteraceae bacterium]|nr:hypothetical protein [Solirubrobacteraceae bacterium]